MLEIYRRRLEDDVPTLLELGLVEQVQEDRHQHEPQTFTKKDLSTIDQVLPELVAVEKGYFKPQLTNLDPWELMERIQSRLGSTDNPSWTGMRKTSKSPVAESAGGATWSGRYDDETK